MSKIRIVHFVEMLGKGGLENVILHIVSNLDPARFEPMVVCRIRGGYTADKIAARNIPLHIIGQNKIPVLKLKKTLSAYRGTGPSILHCHGLFAASTEALAGPLAGYQAVFVHVHNLEKPKTLYQKLKMKLLDRSVTQFLAVSQGVGDLLSANQLEKVKTVHNGIDTDRFKFFPMRAKSKFDIPASRFTLGMVGRIVKRKGFDKFLKVLQSAPEAAGVIVGQGDYEPELRAAINLKQLNDRVHTLPFVAQRELPAIFAGLDALFLFSEKEGLPLAILEAQSVGVPYIGNRVGGIGEVIQSGVNGFLFDTFDVDAIKKAISAVSLQPDRFRINSRKAVAENFSITSMLTKIEKCYLSSLG